MSTPATPTGWDWNTIATDATEIIAAIQPLIDIAAPGASAAVAMVSKIAQGVIAEEPAAVALWNQITSGNQITPEQLQAYATSYETKYQKLDADIAAKLAALQPAK